MTALRADRPGIALLVVVLLTMAVAAMAAGAALIGANSFLINQYDQRLGLLETVADAGLELGRARLNADPTLFNDSAPVTLERSAVVYDVDGTPIRGVRRTVYALPVGGGVGVYGSFGTLIAIAEDGDGARTLRRLDLTQRSFATYAYFTDLEPSSPAFGNGERVFGSVHSNGSLRIAETGATFHDPVTTAGDLVGAEYATFLADTATHVGRIPMPSFSDLTRLRSRAEEAGLSFVAPDDGGPAQSGLRLFFIARDVDGDGAKEGFVRVYRSSDPAWVTGDLASIGAKNPRSALAKTPNCGHYEDDGTFNPTPDDHIRGHVPTHVLNSATRRCFLGGADELSSDPANPDGRFVANDGKGQWLRYPGNVDPAVADEPDGAYLFPLDRSLNPGFQGVIYVEGRVVVSGTVRGHVTVAATQNIIIGDDIVYATDPGTGTCEDILGLFAGSQVIVADNTLNAPQTPTGGVHRSYDDTTDEFIHGSILALDRFTVENWATGDTDAEPCNALSWGRGCLQVYGGVVQSTRGAIGSEVGTGYIGRYSQDACTLTVPPPFFPSTGHFYRNRYYEMDPTGFDLEAFFDAVN